jgi:hypothetical protein
MGGISYKKVQQTLTLIDFSEALDVHSVRPLVVGPGDTVTIEGSPMRPTLRVASNGAETITPTSVSDSKITFDVPNNFKFYTTELPLTHFQRQKSVQSKNNSKHDLRASTSTAD